MKTLVLGATGMIGNHIVRELLKDGHEVTALSRGITPSANLEGLDIKRIKGDLNDLKSLEAAFQGMDWVFQAAAYYPLNAFHKDHHVKQAMLTLNNVIQASLSSGIKRLIYTSSLTAIGQVKEGELADESHAYNFLGKDPHPYFLVKHLSEEALRESVKKDNLPVVMVLPTGCFGPYDLKPYHMCLVPQLMKRQIPGYIDHIINVVDTQDVARGHILAAEKGKLGERYILGGHNTNMREVVREICAAGGVPAPSLKLPLASALALGYIDETISYLMKKSPKYPLLSTKFLQYAQLFSIAKAQTELGYQPQPMARCYQEAIGWFKKIGYC